MTSSRPGTMPGRARRSGGRLGGQVGGTSRATSSAVSTAWWTAVPVVLGHAEVERGQRADASRPGPTSRSGVAEAGVGGDGRRRAGRRPRPGPRPARRASAGREARNRSRHPDAAHLERHGGELRVVGAVGGHQLGRAARRCRGPGTGPRPGRGRPRRRPSTAVPRRCPVRSSGIEPGGLAGRRAGTRRRWRRPGPPRWRPADPGRRRGGPSPPGTRPARPGTGRRPRGRAVRWRPPPGPSRVIRISRSSGRPAASATSSRVELVPQSMAAMAGAVAIRPCYHAPRTTTRSGTGLVRRAGGQAGWRPIRRAVHSPTGSSAPVSHQARWAWRHLTPSRVPPTPPDGRGPVWPGSIRASRSAA